MSLSKSQKASLGMAMIGGIIIYQHPGDFIGLLFGLQMITFGIMFFTEKFIVR